METEKTEFEVNASMPFGKGQIYIVGYDTLGDGVRFDPDVYVCYNNEDLNSEIYRVIETYDLEQESLTLEEQIVIAELKTTPNLNYREFTLEKKYK